MQFLEKLLIAAAFIYCNKFLKDWSNFNEMLFNKTVNYFLPKDMQNCEIKMDHYLCRYLLPLLRYYGTCCIDAFLSNSLTSMEEYVNGFFKLNEIRDYVTKLPAINTEDTSAEFRVE